MVRKKRGNAVTSHLRSLPSSMRKSSVVDTKLTGQSSDQQIVCKAAKVESTAAI